MDQPVTKVKVQTARLAINVGYGATLHQGSGSLLSMASHMHSFARRGGISGQYPIHHAVNPFSSAGIRPPPCFRTNSWWKASSLKLANQPVLPSFHNQSCQSHNM